MSTRWLHRNRIVTGLVGLAWLLCIESAAFADNETLAIGTVPYCTGVAAYPNSFNGLGIAASAYHHFVERRMGVGLDYQSVGSGLLITPNFRYYWHGMPQTPTVTGTSRAPAEMKLRTWGTYVETGASYYVASQDGPLTPPRNGLPSTAGFGVLLSAGVEYPLFSGLFLDLKESFFSSLGGPVNTFNTEAVIGLPFRF